LLIDDPADREAVRHTGRLIYNLAIKTSRQHSGDPSMTNAESEAAIKDWDKRSLPVWGVMLFPQDQERRAFWLAAAMGRATLCGDMLI
jgi:hypothetical protein